MWSDDVAKAVGHEYDCDACCAFGIASEVGGWHLESEDECNVRADDVVSCMAS